MPRAIQPPRPASLSRRLAALFYDLVLLFGVLALAATLVVIPYIEYVQPYFPGTSLWFRGYLLTVIVGFFVYFWTHGGQTLGMRAWRIRLVRDDGAALGTGDAVRRLAFAAVALAPAGLGLLWMLLDPARLALHDRLSRTRIIVTDAEV